MAGRRIVQQRIVEVQMCVADDTATAYLYLVDEFSGIPVLTSPYPCEVAEKKLQVLQHTLPLMYLNVVYNCAVAGSISGLVKLIFEAAAYSHIPTSWTTTLTGVKFQLNKRVMEQQVAILHASLSELEYDNKTEDKGLGDLQFFQSYTSNDATPRIHMLTSRKSQTEKPPCVSTINTYLADVLYMWCAIWL